MTGPDGFGGFDGRAGHEAARLLSAAQDWLRTSAPHLAPVGEDGEPCSCPLCRAVVGLRDADPDSVARWVDAAVTGASAALAQVADATSGAGPTADDDAGADADVEDTSGGGTSGGAAPESDQVGHDGAAPRRVRRIRLDGDVGPDLP
jgi:hypothetical protein